MSPSAVVAEFHAQERGELAPLQMFVQLLDPIRRKSIETPATPAPVSVAVAVSVLVPVRKAPGSASATTGPRLSSTREAIVADVRERPLVSVATARSE
jgi:hypothetical protein